MSSTDFSDPEWYGIAWNDDVDGRWASQNKTKYGPGDGQYKRDLQEKLKKMNKEIWEEHHASVVEVKESEKNYRLKEAKKMAYCQTWFTLPWLELRRTNNKLLPTDTNRGFKWGDPRGLEEFYQTLGIEIERLGLLKYYSSRSDVITAAGPPTESELTEIKEDFYWNKIDNMKRREIDCYGKLLHSPEYWKEETQKLREKYEP